MVLLSFSLVLLSAFIHAYWNLVAKKDSENPFFILHTTSLGVAIWLPINLFLVFTNPDYSLSSISAPAWGIILCSAAVHCACYFSLMHSYRIAPFSVVYPTARGTAPVLTACAAILLLGESSSVALWCGLLVITCGIVLLSKTGHLSDSVAVLRGIKWGGITACLIASCTFMDAYCVKELAVKPLQLSLFISIFQTILSLPFFGSMRKPLSIDLTRIKPALLVAAISPLSYILFLLASQLSPLSHVAPARELSIVFGAFLGGKVLKEGHPVRKMIASGLIALGVILISLLAPR